MKKYKKYRKGRKKGGQRYPIKKKSNNLNPYYSRITNKQKEMISRVEEIRRLRETKPFQSSEIDKRDKLIDYNTRKVISLGRDVDFLERLANKKKGL